MDYEREVRLGETLRERVIDAHANLVVPRSFADMSTEHILVQERIGGTSVAEIMRNPEPPTPAQRQTLQETVTAVLLLPFSTGLVHADPHPGNIRLLDDGRIALLDFGAIDDKLVDLEVYRRLLTATVKAMDGTMTAAEALEAYFAAYAPKLYRAMEVTSQALGLPPVLPLLAKASMGKDTANTPQSSFKGSLLALADINKLVNPNNRFRLRGSLQNVSYARAIHTVTQTLQIMGLQDEIAAALYYIHDRLQNNQAPAWEAQRNNGLSTTEAKEIVYGWLEEVLEHNPLMIGELANIFETLRGSITEQQSREV
jgi:tRNA A-37 threonylcarbamoyl transferase component Bud32